MSVCKLFARKITHAIKTTKRGVTCEEIIFKL